MSAPHWDMRGQGQLKDNTIRAGSSILVKYPAES